MASVKLNAGAKEFKPFTTETKQQLSANARVFQSSLVSPTKTKLNPNAISWQPGASGSFPPSVPSTPVSAASTTSELFSDSTQSRKAVTADRIETQTPELLSSAVVDTVFAPRADTDSIKAEIGPPGGPELKPQQSGSRPVAPRSANTDVVVDEHHQKPRQMPAPVIVTQASAADTHSNSQHLAAVTSGSSLGSGSPYATESPAVNNVRRRGRSRTSSEAEARAAESEAEKSLEKTTRDSLEEKIRKSREFFLSLRHAPASMRIPPELLDEKHKEQPYVLHASAKSPPVDWSRSNNKRPNGASSKPGSGGPQSPRGPRGPKGGGGGGGKGGRGGHGGRGGPEPPILLRVEPLQKTENRYQVSRDLDEDTKTMRTLQSIMNKVTPEKFETLLKKASELRIDTPELLQEGVSIVFEKALAEPGFSPTYAEFCRRLAPNLPSLTTNDNVPVSFRKLLLNKCQSEFEGKHLTDSKDMGTLSDEQRAAAHLSKKRMLGTIRFIGELFVRKVLAAGVMRNCIHLLSQNSGVVNEENIEALCDLLKTVGKELDKTKDEFMNTLFVGLEAMSDQKEQLPSRLRFMLKDVLDLRRDSWVARRQQVVAKTLSEIRKDTSDKVGVKKPVKSATAVAGGKDKKGAGSKAGGKGESTPTTPKKPGGRGKGSPTKGDPEEDEWETIGSRKPNTKKGKPVASLAAGSQASKKSGGKDSTASSAHASPVKHAKGGASASASSTASTAGSGGGRGGAGKDKDSKDKAAAAAPKGNAYAGLEDEDEDDEEADEGEEEQQDESAEGDDADADAGAEEDEEGDEEEEYNDEEQEESKASASSKRKQDSKSSSTSTSSSKSGSSNSSGGGGHKSDREVEARIKSLINEYFAAQDKKEAVLCVHELKAGSLHHKIVSAGFVLVLDLKERERNLLRDLLQYFFEQKILSTQDFARGFEESLIVIEDLSIDTPQAPVILAKIMASAIVSGALLLSFLTTEAMQPLKDNGEQLSSFLIAVLKEIQSLKGDEFLSKMWKDSAIDFNNFIQPGSAETAEALLSKHNLASLLS